MTEQYPQNIYGRYCLPDDVDHRPAAAAILRGEVYEPDTLAFMRAHCAGGDVIHAGTFFGDFLPGLSNALAPGSLIWAFEPNPDNCRAAEATIRLNGLENVRLTEAAVSDAPGSLFFRTHDFDGTPSGGGSYVVEHGGRGKAAVRALRLDDAIPPDREISILQLDVEGHELPALTGALGLIERCRPILILERLDDGAQMLETLSGMGYSVVAELHGNQVLSPRPLVLAKMPS